MAAQSETCPYGALPFYGIDHLSNITAPGHSPIPGDGVVNVSNIESLSGLTPQQYADQASIAVGEQPGFFYWGPFGVLSFKAFGQGQLPVTLDSSFKTPVTRSLTFGVQRQVGSNWVVSADYYYKQIRNILGTRQTNLPFESRIPGNTFDGQPLNGYGSWYEGNYHAAIIAVNKRVSRRFSFGGSYTFTHATDNLGCGNLTAGVTGGCFPSDSFVGMTTVVTDPVSGKTNKDAPFTASNGNPVPKAGIFYNGPNLDKGPSSLALPHTLEAHGLVQLPWQFEISSLFRVQEGFAYSKSLDVPLDVDGNNDFTSTDFISGRNHFRAPNFTNLDLRVAKAFAIRERFKIQTFFEFFNLFNNKNPAAVQTFEGQTTPFGTPQQVLPGMEGQVGIRIEF